MTSTEIANNSTVLDTAKLTINLKWEVGVRLSKSTIKFYPLRQSANTSIWRHPGPYKSQITQAFYW